MRQNNTEYSGITGTCMINCKSRRLSCNRLNRVLLLLPKQFSKLYFKLISLPHSLPMKQFVTFLCSLSLLAGSGCKSDKDVPRPNGIVGRWQLTTLECYCVPSPTVPNEAVEFDEAGNTVFYKDGQVESRGTYQFTTSKFCGSPESIPVMRISNLPGIYDNNIAYTLDATTLVLDQGLCTDAPRKTYRKN